MTMKELFEVKASPDKGLGVFAIADVSPGTVVMTDAMKLRLRRPKNDVYVRY